MVAPKPETPGAKKRRSLADAQRERAGKNKNLWLIYSPKTRRDWVVQGDLAFVHWLIFLETNPTVSSFHLPPFQTEMIEDLTTLEPNAKVTLCDLSQEWHYFSKSPRTEVVINPRTDEAPIILRYVLDADIRLGSVDAVKWIRALSYASALREFDGEVVKNEIIYFISNNGSGSIGQVVENFDMHDAATVVGIIVELAISNFISLDFGSDSFGRNTRWLRS